MMGRSVLDITINYKFLGFKIEWKNEINPIDHCRFAKELHWQAIHELEGQVVTISQPYRNPNNNIADSTSGLSFMSTRGYRNA